MEFLWGEPTNVAIAFALAMQLIALVWGAASVVNSLKGVAQRIDAVRNDLNDLYRRVNRLEVRAAVSEALQERRSLLQEHEKRRE